jgi:hypothetical protein
MVSFYNKLCARTPITLVIYLWIVLTVSPRVAGSQNVPSLSLDAVIANAKAAGDSGAEHRALNLRAALGTLKPSDLNGVRCGKDSPKLTINVDQAQDAVGKLLGKALETYLPTLAAALASAPAAAAATFLTPTRIGNDSVEILSNSDSYSKADVNSAARQLLQDTTPQNFVGLPKPLMAKIVACSM